MVDDGSSTGTGRPGTRIQSVARAAQILIAIARSNAGLTAVEVSRLFELSQPTAYHLLATLVDETLIVKDAARRYVLGPAASIIATAIAAQDTPSAEHLRLSREIAARTQETVYLSAWRGNQIRVLETIEGSHVLRIAEPTGGYTKLTHARASAKVLLAFASSELRDRVIAEMTFEKVTESTITSEEAYRRQVSQTARTGFGYDREEFYPGVICISAPIWESGEVHAAITVGMPIFRFKSGRKRVESILREVLPSR